MELRPIKAKKIYEEIVEQIRQLMAGGDLKPGDKLLSERDLAEKLQVSRASVREALRALEMMGFVEIKSGGGTYVRESCSDSIIQPLAMFISIERGSVLEIFEIRKILETSSVQLAAQRATHEEIARIGETVQKMEESLIENDSEKGEEQDASFHYAIAEATHNSFLIRLLKTISEEVFRTISVARRKLYETPGNPDRLMEQHRKTYEAIRDRNPELAAQCMMEHLLFAEGEMKRMIDE